MEFAAATRRGIRGRRCAAASASARRGGSACRDASELDDPVRLDARCSRLNSTTPDAAPSSRRRMPRAAALWRSRCTIEQRLRRRRQRPEAIDHLGFQVVEPLGVRGARHALVRAAGECARPECSPPAAAPGAAGPPRNRWRAALEIGIAALAQRRHRALRELEGRGRCRSPGSGRSAPRRGARRRRGSRDPCVASVKPAPRSSSDSIASRRLRRIRAAAPRAAARSGTRRRGDASVRRGRAAGAAARGQSRSARSIRIVFAVGTSMPDSMIVVQTSSLKRRW